MTEPLSPDLTDLLALHLVPGLGPRLTAALLERFGSAAAVRRAAAGDLERVPKIGAKLAQDFAQALRTADVAGEVELLRRHGVTVVAKHGPGYPSVLNPLPDAPPLIYLRGEMTDSDATAVGLVGSRRCTPYGRRMAERLAAGLARAGWTVVSGLARGIDGVAHRAALEAGGRTVAVLAGGLSRIYPPEHAGLAGEICAGRGALVSETPMAMDPLPGMFPARNRIISGLSRGVVVIEADERSGALITATHALEQGREVFAVPGPADSAASAGCLKLIRDGARLVRSAEDILEDLAGVAPPVEPAAASPAPAPKPSGPPAGLDDEQRRVWDALGDRPRFADDLTRELGLSVGDLSRVLMGLEMKRVIRRLPGNQYERRG
jgi:DNA processing protein